jgi:hypothetical protein
MKTSLLFYKAIFKVSSIEFLFLCTFCLVSLNAFAVEAYTQVTVDFSKPEKVQNLSGFLGTLSEDLISDEHIEPLKPGLMSVKDEKQLLRAKKLGLEPYVLLSYYWGYPGIAAQFRRQAPYNHLQEWKEVVSSVVDTFGDEVTYYVWNEPDMPIFFGMWPGNSKENFYLVFKEAHDVIREKLGYEVKIAGPTFSFLNSDFEGFMQFAKENQLRVDVLSFHMLYQKDSKLDGAMNRVKELRSLYVDEGNAFESVGLKEIHVNEYLRADRQNSRPGSILNFLRKLEQSGVDRASRACWADPSIPCVGFTCMGAYFIAEWFTPGTCRDGSINGLVNKKKQVRASWWAYKSYVDGVDSRTKAESSSVNITALASSSSDFKDKAQIILAHTQSRRQSSEIKLSLKGISSLPFMSDRSESLVYSVSVVPYQGSGAKPVEKLALRIKSEVAIENDEAEIVLDPLEPYEALVIKVINSISL